MAGYGLIIGFLLSCCFVLISSHNDDAPPVDCNRSSDTRLQAAYHPGIITVDGNSSDWKSIPATSFTALQAINPDPASPYPSGSFSIKVAHDGRDVFFLLDFPGPYAYTEGSKHLCPSVSLMFGIGDDATYYDMGGCKETPQTCSSVSCNGYAVDLIHFKVSTAIPGRLYGANAFDNANSTGKDSFGSLNDMYAWNPHCRSADGLLPNGSKIPNSGSQNDWRGSWSHSSMDLTYGYIAMDTPYSTPDVDGTYTFEFARPLRTTDRLQQDVQFTIGVVHRFMAALWFPVNHSPWAGSQHYTASCDWIPLEIVSSSINPVIQQQKSSNAFNILSFILSLAAFFTSAVLLWRTLSKRAVPFQAIDSL